MMNLRSVFLVVAAASIGACLSPGIVGDSPPDTDGGDGSGGDGTVASSGGGSETETGNGPGCDDGGGVPCETPTCEDARGHLGCSFTFKGGLNTAPAWAEEAGQQIERTAVWLTNPNIGLDATVQLFEVGDGTSEVEPVGEPLVIAGGETARIDRPLLHDDGTTTQFRTGGVDRVESDIPIAATLHGPWRPFVGNDSTLLLPDRTLGSTYVIPSFAPHAVAEHGLGEPSFLYAIAHESTSIRWRSAYTQTNGNGIPISAVPQGEWSAASQVNAYDVLRLAAETVEPFGAEWTRDLSGLVLEADHPIWVLAGARCSAVPASSEASDFCGPLLEQVVPLHQWGRTYPLAIPPLRNAETFFVRVYAGSPGVNLVAPEAHAFTERGEYIDLEVSTGAGTVVEADGPVMAVGYLASRNDVGEAIGDPAMLQFTPQEQFLSEYTVSVPTEWETNYLQIVRQAGGPAVFIGDDLELGSWTEFLGYELVILEVSSQVHRVYSEGTFGVTQIGYHNAPHESCEPYTPDGECSATYAHSAGTAALRLWDP